MSARDAFRLLDPADFPVRVKISARYTDLDPLRHINNVAVADIFGEGRNALMHTIFDRAPRPEGLMLMVGQVGLTYLGEAHYPSLFEIAGGVLSIGKSSFRLGQAFFDQGRCTSVAETVLIATKRHHATELSSELRAALAECQLDESRFPRILV